MRLTGPIKGETFESARQRISQAIWLQTYVAAPIGIVVFAWLAFQLFVNGNVKGVETVFPYFWFLIALSLVLFFWRTRDIFNIVIEVPMTLKRGLLGTRAEDPVADMVGELPPYLRCPDCGEALMYRKRLTYGFHGKHHCTGNPPPRADQSWSARYRDLRERVESFGSAGTVLGPMLILPGLAFGGLYLGSRVGPPAFALLGFFVGGIAGQALFARYTISKLGFLHRSTLKCPQCQAAVARWNGFGYSIDWECRKCGHSHAREAGL